MPARPLEPELLVKLLDYAPGLVMLVDGDLRIRWVNRTASDLFGYDVDDAIGRSILDFIDVDWDPDAFQSIATAMSSEGMRLPMTFRAVGADGSTTLLEVTANSQFHDPDVNGFVVYARPWEERWLLDRTLDAMAADEPVETSLELLVQVAGAETLGAVASLMYDRHVGRVRSAVASEALPIDLTGPVPGCSDAVAREWLVLLDDPSGRIYDVADLPPALGAAAKSAGFRSLLLWPAEKSRGSGAWAAAWRTEPPTDADEARRKMMARLATLVGLIVERGRAAADLAWAATHDELTALLNRASLFDELDQRLDRPGGPIGVIYLDLDGFKTVNDAFGHSAGDRFLQHVADRMRDTAPAGALLARLGGDEFVIVADLDAEELAKVAARVVAELELPTVLRSDDEPVSVGASAGVAVSTDRRHTTDQLLDAADRGLYASKGTSTRVTVIDP